MSNRQGRLQKTGGIGTEASAAREFGKAAEASKELKRETEDVLAKKHDGEGFSIKTRMDPEDFDDMRLSIAVMGAKINDIVNDLDDTLEVATMVKDIIIRERDILRLVVRLAKTHGIDLEKHDAS